MNFPASGKGRRKRLLCLYIFLSAAGFCAVYCIVYQCIFRKRYLSRARQMKLKSSKWTLLQIPKALPQKLAGYKAAMETKLIKLYNLSSISSNLCNKRWNSAKGSCSKQKIYFCTIQPNTCLDSNIFKYICITILGSSLLTGRVNTIPICPEISQDEMVRPWIGSHLSGDKPQIQCSACLADQKLTSLFCDFVLQTLKLQLFIWA